MLSHSTLCSWRSSTFYLHQLNLHLWDRGFTNIITNKGSLITLTADVWLAYNQTTKICKYNLFLRKSLTLKGQFFLSVLWVHRWNSIHCHWRQKSQRLISQTWANKTNSTVCVWVEKFLMCGFVKCLTRNRKEEEGNILLHRILSWFHKSLESFTSTGL